MVHCRRVSLSFKYCLPERPVRCQFRRLKTSPEISIVCVLWGTIRVNLPEKRHRVGWSSRGSFLLHLGRNKIFTQATPFHRVLRQTWTVGWCTTYG